MDFLHGDDIWKFIKAKDEHDNPDTKSKDFNKLETSEDNQ